MYEREAYTLRFLLTERLDTHDEPELVLIETYQDEDGVRRHQAEPHFETISRIISTEDLLSKPPRVVYIRNVGGFDLDRKTILRP